MKIKILILSVLSAFLFSCNNNSLKEVDENASKNDSNEISNEKPERNTIYKIPSPFELYNLLEIADVKYNSALMNKKENINNYQTQYKQALNLGIYASDVAYSVIYKDTKLTLDYFNAAKTLANNLNLIDGFDENLTKRIEANMNNSDSLYIITTDSYLEISNSLQAKNNNTLPLIIAGGWVEELYIATKTINNYTLDNPVITVIADNQLTLDNLINFIKGSTLDDNTKLILKQLVELQTIYDETYENTEDVILTEGQLKKISKKIELIRNEIIK